MDRSKGRGSDKREAGDNEGESALRMLGSTGPGTLAVQLSVSPSLLKFIIILTDTKQLCIFMEYGAVFQHMHRMSNARIGVIGRSLTSDIYHFFVLGAFKKILSADYPSYLMNHCQLLLVYYGEHSSG